MHTCVVGQGALEPIKNAVNNSQLMDEIDMTSDLDRAQETRPRQPQEPYLLILWKDLQPDLRRGNW